MELKVKETHGGQFEVVRMMPETLGTFYDPNIAEKFRLFMAQDLADEEQVCLFELGEREPIPPLAVSSDATLTATATAQHSDDRSASAAPVKPTMAESAPKVIRQPAKLSDVDVDGASEWTPEELAAAFACLEDGEKLRDVARDAGKCWVSLRSRWANHKRQLAHPKQARVEPTGDQLPVPRDQHDQTPVEKVTTAIQELQNQQTCTCGKKFALSQDNSELCARCRHAA